MATKILEFRRSVERPPQDELLAAVSIRSRLDVVRAARHLKERAARDGMRVIAWADITTLEPMIDTFGKSINTTAFGWDAEGPLPLDDRERALQSQVLRICRKESEPFWLNHAGVRTCWTDRYPQNVSCDDIEELCGVKAAVVVPVHLPFAQIAAAMLTSIDPERTDLAGVFTSCCKDLVYALDRFLKGYARLHRDGAYLYLRKTLSPRARSNACVGQRSAKLTTKLR
jgi:hypothetical protein